MLSLKTILAPVDFSERTEAEAQSAADIARHFGSRLILLHVIPAFAEMRPSDPTAARAYSHEFSADITDGIEDALQALSSRVAGGADVECVVLAGSPSEKIEEFAKERLIDLIVMPTTDNGRIQRQLFGSAITTMLQDLNCPVLTGIPAPEDRLDRKNLYERIGCKVEPGELAPIRLRWARDFAAAYSATLSVVGVLPLIDGVGTTPPLPEHLHEKAMREAAEKLQALCAQQDAQADVTVLGGPIDDVLPPFVAANEIDLLVSGRSRYEDTVGVFGVHTDIIDTVKRVPCPMVLV